MLHRLVTVALLTPTLALAVGSDSSTPPTATETTTECEGGKVWDEKTEECVAPQDSRLNDDIRYQAVRELAYAGQYDNSLRVLASMADQNASRVLTYYGFNLRKSGDQAAALAYYDRALAADPDNLLARSYLGQAMVEAGNLVAARAQLGEIRARGGRQTWAEASLRLAIQSGQGFSY